MIVHCECWNWGRIGWKHDPHFVYRFTSANMKANMFNGVMKAVVSLMFLGLAALPGHGLPLLSRPEYGVLYSSNGKIQNAASYWTMYFEVRKLTEEIVPQVVRKNLAGNHLCHVEISNNDTTPSSVKALKTMAEVCKGYETVIKKYDLQKSQLILEIDLLKDSINSVMKQPRTSNRKRRDVPLGFIGSISNNLFGLAKQSQVQALAALVGQLRQQVNSTGDVFIRHQELLGAAFELQDNKINVTKHQVMSNQQNILQLVSNMRELESHVSTHVLDSINDVEVIHQMEIAQNQLLANLLKGTVAQITALQKLYQDIYQFHQAVQTLLEGNLPLNLITPTKLESILHQISTSLMVTHPSFSVAIPQLHYYYDLPVDLEKVTSDGIIVSINIPLTTGPDSTFDLYEIKTVKVPVWHTNGTVKASTMISRLPRYLAVSENVEYFIEMDSFDLTHCEGKHEYKICDPFFVQTSTRAPTCAMALYQMNKEQIKELCHTEYYNSNDIPMQIMPLGNGKVLLSDPQHQWTVECDRQASRIINRCAYCVLQLGCGCQLRSTRHILPPYLNNCTDTKLEQKVFYPVNAMTYLKYFDAPQNFNFSVNVETSPKFPTNFSGFRIMGNDATFTAQDGESAPLDLDKILQLMKQNKPIYESPSAQVYAETKLLRQLFYSPFGQIAGAVMLVINVVTALLGLYTFIKVRNITGLMTLLFSAKPVKAELLSPTNYTVNAWQLMLCFVVMLLLYRTAKLVTPMMANFCRQYTRQTALQPHEGPRVNPHCLTHIYLKLTNEFWNEPIYLCTLNTCPTNLDGFTTGTSPRLRLISNYCGLSVHMCIDWNENHIVRRAEQSRVVLPVTVPLSLLRVRKIKLILTRDYQVCIMKGQYNLYEQIPMTNNLDDVIRNRPGEDDANDLDNVSIRSLEVWAADHSPVFWLCQQPMAWESGTT